ncbi:hypothetical protein NDU88_006192 [Pleurodeles waltl]|uniref:Uncharacterized protein n=1 Tax=Pleurodeles waltl TaxID=8319 RepID=A0AAV7TXK8_PLEWA|nr:hypothetical protein NDU88_006192 [Pleurodeles waltl]
MIARCSARVCAFYVPCRSSIHDRDWVVAGPHRHALAQRPGPAVRLESDWVPVACAFTMINLCEGASAALAVPARLVGVPPYLLAGHGRCDRWAVWLRTGCASAFRLRPGPGRAAALVVNALDKELCE